ncbi:hypothetical protein HDV63DRAFT_396909 [Trichoderma sp. SZMC 28014]
MMLLIQYHEKAHGLRYYLDRVPLYNIEKPYSMRYLPEEDVPQSNYVKVKHPISARSLREAGTFRIEELQSVYIPEVKQALKLELGANYVHVLDYAVRKRHEGFPVSTGKEYLYDQLTALAHIGKSGVAIPFMFCNLKEERTDNALCGARSVNFTNDTTPGDIVFDDFATENLLIFPSPNFQCADSDETAVSGCPHSRFYNPHAREGNLRESLDCRAFVFYADLEEYPPIVGDVFRAKSHMV